MVIHAAGESSDGQILPGTHSVALAADSEIQLLTLEKRLISQNISHVAIREPDKPYCNQLMAIGIAPGDRALIRKEVSQLPLIK